MIGLSLLRKTLEISIFLATRRRNLANAFLTENGPFTYKGGRKGGWMPSHPL